MTTTYKLMDVSQIPDMTQLYIETFNAPPWNDSWTKETVERRLHQMINVEDFYGLCAYRGETLCGMILGCKEQYYDGMNFYIREFCIRNSMRGMGLGKEIFLTFQKHLEDMGISSLTLYTLRGEYTETFYHKLGFENTEDLVLMKRKRSE